VTATRFQVPRHLAAFARRRRHSRAAAAQGLGPVAPRRVTKTFRNTTRVLIDVESLSVTPGHEVLSDGGEWMSVAEMPRRDRALVRDVADGEGGRRGEPVRACTGARLGGLGDIVFETRFRDPDTGALSLAEVRGGIPFEVVGFRDGRGRVEAALLPLYLALQIGAERPGDAPAFSPRFSLASGAPRDASGRPLPVLDWPEGRTPFDHPGGDNFVVAVDGTAYAPRWIEALPLSSGDTLGVAANCSERVHPEQLGEGGARTYRAEIKWGVFGGGWT
jgi:hypothetical protein